MSTNSNDPPAGSSGLRRRHSGPDSTELEQLSSDSDGVHTGHSTLPAPSRRSESDARPSRHKDSSAGSERQHVRFVGNSSTSRPARPGFKHKHSDPVVPSTTGKSPLGRRTHAPDLSVNTNVGATSSIPGKSPVQSPTSSISPTSATRKHRGMSLRSTMFERNIRHNHRQEHGTIIEMEDAGPSARPSHGRSPSFGRSSKKSTQDSIVEISPLADGEDVFGPGRRSAGEAKSIYQDSHALPNYRSWNNDRKSRYPAWRSVKQAYKRARKFILRINEIPPSKDGRHIDLDPSRKSALVDERTGHPYISNFIRSSRYTAYNFVPRQLYFQFSKVANFYFLCVSILQMIPGLSTTGTYTTIIPLLFFVAISMAKEGYDDLRRYRLDKVENNREVDVLHAYGPQPSPELSENDIAPPNDGPIHWAKTKWQDVQVGDVIKLERDEALPADLLLLNSKGANNIAYIETMALDGETNLKNKQVLPSIAKDCTSIEQISCCNARLTVEDPNIDLYNFEGKLDYEGKTSPLTNNEIIYRGSILRNTPEAYGMVIYSGEECKIRMNANKNPRTKAPTLQAIVNKVVIVIVIFVIALAIFNTVAYQVWRSNTEKHAWYLSDASVAFFPILTSFIIMFNTMIPLSLYVSLEIIKLCQMLLLNDIDMYDEATNTPFEARTSTINEELGQISYIFSDKTGTLTDNIMKFRKLSVAGTAWLHDTDLQDENIDDELLVHKKRVHKNKGKQPARISRISGNSRSRPSNHGDSPLTPGRISTASQWQSSARPQKSQLEMSTTVMIRYLQNRPDTLFARKAKTLLLSIALCHTCLPERQEDGQIDYQASSPDELALVKAAQELGYLVFNRDSAILSIKTFPGGVYAPPVIEDYEILDVIEFSSKRKRMSVVVRFPDQRVCIICKGADSVLMTRLRLASLAMEKVNEIEQRVVRRKSIEASETLRRQSEQAESSALGRSSFSRGSFSISRRSTGGVGRPSTSNAFKLQPIRDEVDSWLREREQDGVPVVDGSIDLYNPRPSMQAARKSTTNSEAKMSVQINEDQDELVDESLAMDDTAIIERCFQHVNDFATEGLRTLLYGHRFLDQDEYAHWKKIYLDATTSLVDRQSMIEKAGELIERQLELGGATAIEDKLQNGVPEAIDKLRRANIKMWMLTGDKRETAINIGHSCRLIKDYSFVTVLDVEGDELEQTIAAAMLAVQGGGVAHSVIVVDGQTLARIESDATLWKLFLDLAISVDSVVCCRASPSQKAGLVKAIRKRVKTSITLAIGDGANDIAMIQEAHVGIGITGKEGLQAARSSDYSIAQFRFLTKLLLVHGRWNYVRICKYTVGTFWKEMMFYLVQALFQRYSGYTGTSLYESWSLSLFNTFFTSLCVIFLGIFEKDLQAATLLAVPELYNKGQRNRGFNFRVYLSWMFMAASESMIIFFTMLGLFGNVTFTTDNDLYAMGDMCFTACIILINVKLQVLELHNKSIMAAIALFLSIGGWFLWNLVLSAVYHGGTPYNVKHGFLELFGRNPLWWLVLVLTVVSTLYFEIAVRSLKAAYFPTDVDTFQCLEQDLAIRKRFEEASAMELQAGWHRGSKKSSLELAREAQAQAVREGEVEEMLINRPDTVRGPVNHDDNRHDGKKGSPTVETWEQAVMVEDASAKGRSTDIQEMLSLRFGTVRQGTLQEEQFGER